MMSAEKQQLEMQHMRQKNEDFFKRREPAIYDFIKDKKLTNSDLKILKKEDGDLELDVFEKGKSRYFNAGRHYSTKECEKFIGQMKPGTLLPPFTHVDSNSFTFQRIGSLHFKKLANELGDIIKPSNQIPLPDFYPLLVIMGVGLGLHISKIIKDKKISSLIIFEHKLDRAITSLYTIDWEEIYSKFDINKGESIQLIFSTEDDFRVHQGSLWNELINYCPHFPFATLFYNHLNDETNSKIINKIQKDTITYLQQWGNYDDEINQYNNARQNLLLGAKIYKPSTFKVNPDMPIAVIGAGPSLDDKIETLKKYQDNILIISCGTTIGTLAKHNIRPHFHVELESDYIVYEAIKKSTTADFRKGITLLASAQVNPRCLALFEKSCIYFKDSTALAQLYVDNDKDIVKNTTPTCTNAGVAIAFQMRPKNLFLFGTDFGFSNKDKHHASGSIYYQDKEDISFVLANANDFEKEVLIKTTSVKGLEMETKPMYFTAQRRVEECIKYSHLAGIKVFNCSDGASIKNSHWIPTEKLNEILMTLNTHASPKSLTREIYNYCQSVNPNSINEKSTILLNTIDSIFNTINRIELAGSELYDISKYIFIVNNIISRHVKLKLGYMHYFLRGQIWIFLTMFFTYSLHCKTKKERQAMCSLCTEWLKQHHIEIITEMKKVLYHTKNLDEDEWINTTVEEEI